MAHFETAELVFLIRFGKSSIIVQNLDVSDTTGDEKRGGRWLPNLYFVFSFQNDTLRVKDESTAKEIFFYPLQKNK